MNRAAQDNARLRLDARTYEYYQDELRFVRDLMWEFAQTRPKIGTRLGVHREGSADPYVNQLLDGVAFLAARVQRKLDDEFPVFTRHLLEQLAPALLAPLPSMTVVAFQPELRAPGLDKGVDVPRGTPLMTSLPAVSDTYCTYTTAHDVTLLPLGVRQVELLPASRVDYLGLRRPADAAGALRITFETWHDLPVAKLGLDRLRLFMPPAGRTGYELFELVVAQGRGLAVRGDGETRPARHLPISALRLPGLDDDNGMLPPNAAGFRGYELLIEALALPARLLFIDVDGLASALGEMTGSRFELYIFLARLDATLETRLSAENVVLFATPAVNLFERRSSPTSTDPHQRRHRLVVDRTRDLDFEIHSVCDVDGIGRMGDVPLSPLYGSDPNGAGAGFYTLERVPTRFPPPAPSAVGETRGSVYRGSDVYVTLATKDPARTAEDVFETLSASLLCTNRDLPRFVDFEIGRDHFRVGALGPTVRAVTCAVQPTMPADPLAGGRENWLLINYLTPTFRGLFETANAQDGARDLVRLLGAYAPTAAARRPLEALTAVRTGYVTRRLPDVLPPSYAHGLEVVLEFESGKLEGTSAVVIGAVLERFFATFITINAFVEIAVATTEQGEIKRWPPRLGDRRLL